MIARAPISLFETGVLIAVCYLTEMIAGFMESPGGIEFARDDVWLDKRDGARGRGYLN